MKEMCKIIVALVGYIGRIIDCKVSPYSDYKAAAQKNGSRHAKMEAVIFASITYLIAVATVAAIMLALYWALVVLWAATPQSWW